MTANQEKEYQEYLDLFQLARNQYIIGIFQQGITIYNQQVRAFNIFYALHHLNLINEDSRICIIGGGIAGVTFAAAALNAKLKVTLLEKGEVLIPFQSESKQRPIHPHIYDYPKPGSENPNAGLPILDWDAAHADEVREKILKQFKDIEQIYEDRKLNFHNHYHEHLSVKPITSIKYNEKINKYMIKGALEDSAIECDIIIYAIGFGIEKAEHKFDISYWQCTPFHQEITAFPNSKYILSGVGDGGLMDLIMGCIRQFDYDNLLKTIDGDKKGAELKKRLLSIREDFLLELENRKSEGKIVDPDFIYKRYEQILPQHYKHILAGLDRRENSFILHGLVPFKDIFNIDKVSMLNGFLTYLMAKDIYKHGIGHYNQKKQTFTIEGYKEDHKEYKKVSRYGTDTETLLKRVKGLKELIVSSGIEAKQKKTAYKGDIDQLWKDKKEMQDVFKRAFYCDIKDISGNSLQTFETFALMLSKMLSERKKDFRFTIHKVSEQNEILYYQQIIPYFGSQDSKLHGGYGRFFKWDHGSVGYSIASAKPLLIVRHNNEVEYQKILPNLNLESKIMDYRTSDKQSILSIPILANINDLNITNAKLLMTNFVFYIDSVECDFFDAKVFDTLMNYLPLLVKAINNLVLKRQIQIHQSSSLGNAISKIDERTFKNMGTGPLFGSKIKKYSEFVEKYEDGKHYLNNFYLLT